MCIYSYQINEFGLPRSLSYPDKKYMNAKYAQQQAFKDILKYEKQQRVKHKLNNPSKYRESVYPIGSADLMIKRERRKIYEGIKTENFYLINSI